MTSWVKDTIKPAECVVGHRIHTLEEESLSSESRLDRGAFSTASAGFLTEISLRLGLQTARKIKHLLGENVKLSDSESSHLCYFAFIIY